MVDLSRLKLFAKQNSLNNSQIEELCNIVQDIELEILNEVANKLSIVNMKKVDSKL